ncbi:MAG: cysteine--tRNA ligase [Peptoniphilaceae bacterium]|nr:cysteine--tRNA ligase [Peptoniphilaceae bacterium]MDY3075275.1 cysteine--tRNA ligase [Peptoniphilaceae bacterium]
MKIYNTLSRTKQEFQPIEKGKVRMYVCGPTVYDYIHIGNARPLVVFDVMHRYLRWLGYDVCYVVNFTDIDDKIIRRADEEGVDFHEISERYIRAFQEQARSLNLLEAETIHPRATDMVQPIIDFIQGLVDKDAAYDAEDAVYFRVSTDKDYGKLSGKNIEDLRSGARIQVNEKKRNPLDFALWKKQKQENEPAWDSPWGPGRPGWHIECSAMSKEILGTTLDIHAGGSDLEFPHHENEIAQSETLTGQPFAHYWMHNAMITVSAKDGQKEKMSKSKGNFFMLKDIEKNYDLILVRMWLLSAHYRSPINFSREVMEQTKNGYQRLINGKHNMERLLENAEEHPVSAAEQEILQSVARHRQRFREVMDDDLNTADALTAIYEIIRIANQSLNEQSGKAAVNAVYQIFMELFEVLGLEDRSETVLDEEIERLIAERGEARKNRDFQRADEIRDQLKAKGILLKDTPTGMTWSRE